MEKSVKLNIAVPLRVRAPLVPKIFTAKVAGTFELHLSIAVWDGGTVTLFGVIPKHFNPAGMVLLVREMVPLKLLVPAMVMVEVAF
jgi:hypothetical protein